MPAGPLTNSATASPLRQRGAVAIMITIALVAILSMGALVLDGGHLLLSKSRLQNAVDSAALRAAKSMDEGASHQAAKAIVIQSLGTTLGYSDFSVLASALDVSSPSYSGSQVTEHVAVEFSLQPTPFTATTDAAAEYIRVTVAEVDLPVSLASILNFDSLPVSASAVAGPSTPLISCANNLMPMVACQGSGSGTIGYDKNTIMPMKIGSQQNSPIGPGNFQLVRLPGNSGASDIRSAMAGEASGASTCYGPGTANTTIATEPGNTVGPVATGINTRLGLWPNGTVNSSDHPRDKDICVGQMLGVDNDGNVVDEDDALVTDSTTGIYRHSDYQAAYASSDSYNCPYDGSLTWDGVNGNSFRREFTILIGDCDGEINGQNNLDFIGMACFFLTQEVVQKGNDAYVIGEFLSDCSGTGPATNDTTATDGPYTIVLYRDSASVDS